MTLNNLVALEVPLGNWEVAARYADQARHAIRAHVTRVLPSLSEKEQLLFVERNDTGSFQCSLSLALLRAADPKMPALSAGWILNGKGAVQESLAARMLLGRDERNPQLKETVERKMKEVRRELGMLALAPHK